MPNQLVNSFSDTVASPVVDVLIYPYFTGSSSPKGIFFSTLTASQTTGGLRAVEVRKSVLDANGSTFSIQLAPGGPKGVDDIQTWTSIITPMSLVLIGMRRGALKRIVMIGIITSIEETQNWEQDRVERTISIQGMDFTYFFSNFSSYQFTALGVLASNPGVGGLFQSSVAGAAGLSGSDPPINIGFDLYQFMWGQVFGPVSLPPILQNLGGLGEGLMSNTQINRNGQIIPVSDVLTVKFESLLIQLTAASSANNTVTPALWAFTIGDGNWLGQFRDIFSEPWYEFYIMTAQDSDVFTKHDVAGSTGLLNNVPSPDPNAANQITIPGLNPIWQMPNYPDAHIFVVARVSPPPFVDQNGNLHNSDWECLPIYQDNSFIRSTVAFDVAGHGNMMMINPEFMIAAFNGGGASNNAVAAEVAGIATDIYGIAKYGYKPVITSTKWFAGNFPDSTPDSYKDQLQYLEMKMAGLYVPAAQQLMGEVTLPLRPDILPGNRFQYHPFKNDGVWLFYNPGVVHRWEFGRSATTTLQVIRGLPLNLYQNVPNLAQLILGNMEIQYNTDATSLADPSARYVVRSTTSSLQPAGAGSLPGTQFLTIGGGIATLPNPNIPKVL